MTATTGFSYGKLSIFFLLWCICWVVLQTIALELTFAFGWATSLTDAVVTNVIIAVAGYDMILVTKYYHPRPLIRVAISVGLAFLSVAAMDHLTLLFVSETPEYLAFLEKSLIIRGLYSWLMIALVSALSGLWLTMMEHQEMERRRTAAEQLSREAELSRLRQQLQPHFLFNSLNSISALAGNRPEEARRMIQQLSDFFRATIRKDDQQLVVLSEELEHLALYLEIEKVRFGHRLKTEIQCDEKSVGLKLPSLLLQPVVENAIKFGLYDTLGQTTISITSTKENNHLKIVIQNPFDPSVTPPRRGTGFGLNSITRRLYLLYARTDLLQTSQTGNDFITTIKIPQRND